jgi:lipopolysaccharide/colanic/teichoic acid biosynthesis glycosyltransferase
MHGSRLPYLKSGLSRRLLMLDIVAAFVAPIIAFWVRDGSVFTRVNPMAIVVYVGAATFLSIFFFVQFRAAHCLAKFFSFYDAIQIAKASTCAVTATAIMLFTLTRLEEVPRSILPIHFLILTAALIGGRLIGRAIAQRHDLGIAPGNAHADERSVIIVGTGQLAQFYIHLLDSVAADNRRIAAILDDDRTLHGRSIHGHFIMGSTYDAEPLLSVLVEHGVNVAGFVVCERDRVRAHELRVRLAPLCLDRGLELELLSEQLGISFHGGEQKNVHEYSRPRETIVNNGYLRIKPTMESALAAILILVLFPLFALAGLLVIISIGSPVVFWQRRIGRTGRPISIYKFRTMRHPIDGQGRRLTNDERIPLIGRFLRATRLDELPQLYNVVRGDMSLVGPRPLLPADQPIGRELRLAMAPGITGWAQIHGGKLITAAEKNALDAWYVRNASLLLDVIIILRTISIILTGDRRNEGQLAAALLQTVEEENG